MPEYTTIMQPRSRYIRLKEGKKRKRRKGKSSVASREQKRNKKSIDQGHNGRFKKKKKIYIRKDMQVSFNAHNISI